jgi:hypothetical protein
MDILAMIVVLSFGAAGGTGGTFDDLQVYTRRVEDAGLKLLLSEDLHRIPISCVNGVDPSMKELAFIADAEWRRLGKVHEIRRSQPRLKHLVEEETKLRRAFWKRQMEGLDRQGLLRHNRDAWAARLQEIVKSAEHDPSVQKQLLAAQPLTQIAYSVLAAERIEALVAIDPGKTFFLGATEDALSRVPAQTLEAIADLHRVFASASDLPETASYVSREAWKKLVQSYRDLSPPSSAAIHVVYKLSTAELYGTFWDAQGRLLGRTVVSLPENGEVHDAQLPPEITELGLAEDFHLSDAALAWVRAQELTWRDGEGEGARIAASMGATHWRTALGESLNPVLRKAGSRLVAWFPDSSLLALARSRKGRTIKGAEFWKRLAGVCTFERADKTLLLKPRYPLREALIDVDAGSAKTISRSLVDQGHLNLLDLGRHMLSNGIGSLDSNEVLSWVNVLRTQRSSLYTQEVDALPILAAAYARGTEGTPLTSRTLQDAAVRFCLGYGFIDGGTHVLAKRSSLLLPGLDGRKGVATLTFQQPLFVKLDRSQSHDEYLRRVSPYADSRELPRILQGGDFPLTGWFFEAATSLYILKVGTPVGSCTISLHENPRWSTTPTKKVFSSSAASFIKFR